MSYADHGHRPHGDHRGEEPENQVHRGPESLRVTLDTWGPQHNLFPVLYDELQSNWGDAPSRTVNRDHPEGMDTDFTLPEHAAGWAILTDGEREYVRSCFAGRTLPQVLEGISFHFTIDGCDRATTHQIVRTRVGAAFMQHGGRDNDWRHRPYTMPETIWRAIQQFDGQPLTHAHCVTDDDALSSFYNNYSDQTNAETLGEMVRWYLRMGRDLYAALVDAGCPWQDARTLLWTGQETYIHCIYNFLALKGVIMKRHEFIMDWQINCVAQLMLREVRMKCPRVMSAFLGSGSDLMKRDVMAGLESWTPVGKYENPYKSKGEDLLKRRHTPVQNPFWVLHPESAAGHPTIGWVATDGTWPETWPPEPRYCDIVLP